MDVDLPFKINHLTFPYKLIAYNACASTISGHRSESIGWVGKSNWTKTFFNWGCAEFYFPWRLPLLTNCCWWILHNVMSMFVNLGVIISVPEESDCWNWKVGSWNLHGTTFFDWQMLFTDLTKTNEMQPLVLFHVICN